MTRLIAVGACCMDTMLTVPHYPAEDSKLRASHLVRRRGGNCPNTLEILAQLLGGEDGISLDLCAVMPADDAAATQQMRDSLGPRVGTSLCVHREDVSEAPSSFVIQSQESGSRTIVNHNALVEMTAEEFSARVEGNIDVDERVWFHFEGRNTDVGLECMRYLRRQKFQDLTISVEIEKPGREGLEEMAKEADVVFYSRSWAQDLGFTGPLECLETQRQTVTSARLLICTWGEEGAAVYDRDSGTSIQQSPFDIAGKAIVDTNGAGDTFTAGMLYMQLRGGNVPCHSQIDFANELAGRKITQNGFNNLGQSMKAGWSF